MDDFSAFLDHLMAHGQCCFTTTQAAQQLNKSRVAIYSSIEHVKKKGELVSPAKGFYVLVPPQYRVLGCIPAEQFLPQLMTYWKCPYYVGLLSAARFHGASHQAVQVTQQPV